MCFLLNESPFRVCAGLFNFIDSVDTQRFSGRGGIFLTQRASGRRQQASIHCRIRTRWTNRKIGETPEPLPFQPVPSHPSTLTPRHRGGALPCMLVLDRRLNLATTQGREGNSLYALLRCWVHDDPTRQSPAPSMLRKRQDLTLPRPRDEENTNSLVSVSCLQLRANQ